MAFKRGELVKLVKNTNIGYITNVVQYQGYHTLYEVQWLESRNLLQYTEDKLEYAY